MKGFKKQNVYPLYLNKNHVIESINIGLVLGAEIHRRATAAATFRAKKKPRNPLVVKGLSYGTSKRGLQRIKAEIIAESKKCPDRARRIELEGLEACIAMILVILDDIDLVSHYQRSNLTHLAKLANLYTVSAAGNESISRAVRAVELLTKMGYLVTKKAVFNNFDGFCEVKHIMATEKLFQLLSITKQETNRARCHFLGEDASVIISDNDLRILTAGNEILKKKRAASAKRMAEKRERMREAKRGAVFSDQQAA